MCLAVAVLFYMIRVQDSLRRSSANWSDIASPRPIMPLLRHSARGFGCSNLKSPRLRLTRKKTLHLALRALPDASFFCNEILLSGRYATH